MVTISVPPGPAGSSLSANLVYATRRSAISALEAGVSLSNSDSVNRQYFQDVLDEIADPTTRYREMLIEAVPEADGYWGIDQPLALPDYARITGAGYGSHLRNTRTVSATSGDLRCFDFGNHTSVSLLAETYYAFNDATIGALSVTCATASNAANISVGDVVFIKSDALINSLPDTSEVNEVVAVDVGTGVITLKYPLHAAFSGGQKVGKTNGTQSDPLGIPRRFTKGIHVAGLRLATAGNDWWHAAGGCWEALFEDLWIDSRSPAVLNGFARSAMRGVRASFDDRAIELAIACHHSVIEGVALRFKSRGGVTTSEPIVSFGEGAHHNIVRLDHVDAGAHAGSRVVRFITCKDNIVEGGTVLASSQTGDAAVAFSGAAGYTVRNVARNMEIRTNNGVFVKADYGSGTAGQDNLAEALRFYGTVTNRAVDLVDGTGDTVRDCYFETGGFSVAQSGGRLERCRFGASGASRTVTSTSAVVRHNQSGTTAGLKALETEVRNQSVTSTSSGNVVASTTAPASCLEPGDGLAFEIIGNVNGTTDAKNLRLMLNANTVASMSLVAADSGAFRITGRIAVINNTTIKRGSATEVTPTGTNVRRSSFNLNSNTTAPVLELQAWVANAADSITVDQYVVSAQRRYETS